MDTLLKGADPRDRRSLYAEAPPWSESRRRILYVSRFGASPVDPEVAAATDALAQKLTQAGHIVEAGEVFFDLDEAAQIWRVVSRAGVAWLMRENPGFEAKAGAAARAMAEDGRTISGADYLDALEKSRGAAPPRRRVV